MDNKGEREGRCFGASFKHCNSFSIFKYQSKKSPAMSEWRSQSGLRGMETTENMVMVFKDYFKL